MNAAILERARVALVEGLRNARPGAQVDLQGRTADLADNLPAGVEYAWFESDFLESTGPEFEEEMRVVHASSALAVNVFGPWRPDPSALPLTGTSGFTGIRFDNICPTLDGPPAYLDFFAERPGVVVGIEIKCLEYLSRPSPKYEQLYREAYELAARKITDRRAHSGWFDEIRKLQRNPNQYQALFAAQLIKQFIALTELPTHPEATLLYLYWEPRNWLDFEAFRMHREELRRFAEGVGKDEDGVRFRHQSLTELWTAWSQRDRPEWIARHAAWLKARYDVAI